MQSAMNSDAAFPFAADGDPSQCDSLTLVSLCAQNPTHHALWSEFLGRFGGKLKFFIRMTLQSKGGNAFSTRALAGLPMKGEADLLQDTVLRLVENDCAALKRFSGTTEENLFAYFAVIARSVVCDYCRRQRAQKRPRWQSSDDPATLEERQVYRPQRDRSERAPEKTILARELEEISLQAIRDHSGENADRDRLLFRLYFYDDLSPNQISKCKGINLSKAGVERALNRVKDKVKSAAAAISFEARR
jgi:RNA polymerase sigma factor (sigma-70 family)